MKRKILCFLIIFTTSLSNYSQINTLNQDNDILDAKSLIEAYLSPFGNGLAAGLNNGWYNTAKPHSVGGFDFTLTINTIVLPESSTNFNISEVISNNSNFISNSDGITPTFVGNGEGEEMTFNNEMENVHFKMPSGIKLKIFPLPILQAGVGLIKDTEIDARFIPQQKIGSLGEISLLGIGIKHDLLQWVPAINILPIDLAVQAGYTNLNTAFDIQDQKIELDIKSTTFNLVLSKKILMITAHASAGYSSSNTTFNVEGEYDIGIGDDVITLDAESLTKLKFESSNEFKTNIGIRFKLALIALQANHTFAKYPVTTVGIGLSLR